MPHFHLNFKHPLLMGILNLTPDSFSDGGYFVEEEDMQKRINQIIAEGGDILDIGGESSAPNSVKVSKDEEIKRILPALEYCKNKKIIVSVDTYKSEVAKVAIQNGAKIINDVTALRGDQCLAQIIAQNDVYIVLMYSKDSSARTTGEKKQYKNVVEEIRAFLKKRVDYAKQNGIAENKIILDPGMGAFVSREPEPSLKILKNLKQFTSLGYPVLVGTSRKSFIGQILDSPIHDREAGSLASASIATYNGANIIRAHDIQATKRAIKISASIAQS